MTGNIVEIMVLLTPGACKEGINGMVSDANGNKILKVSVFAHAENNRANTALIKLLAKHFKVPKSNISIKSGLKSRKKLVVINNR